MRRLRTLLVAWCAAAVASAAFAQDGWHSLEVPGGRATLRTLGVGDDRDRAGALIEIIRRLHFSTQSQSALEDAIRRLPTAGADTISLPLPLRPATWETVILQRPVPASGMFAAILGDRAARLLYHGLAGLDASTRDWIEQQPNLLRALYRDADAIQSFALFAPAIHVSRGQVSVAGGDAVARRWSAVLDASPDDPARFVSRLFLDRDGRAAGLYFLSTYVEPARREFLTRGGERFAALLATFAACYPRQSNDYPFVIRSKDPAWLLLNVGLSNDGTPAGPRTRGFWNEVFAADEVAASTAARDDGLIDAAWLADRLCSASTVDRSRVFDTLLAGHRLFADTPGIDTGSAMRALRVRRLYPAVFVAIERSGIRSPVAIASAGRAAQMLDRINDMDSTPAVLQQFQGALAIVLGATTTHTLTATQAASLIYSLADIRLREDRYDGRIAAWFEQQLLPALRAALNLPSTLTSEEIIGRALAGQMLSPPRRVEWEGLTYVVDYPASTRDRLLSVRAKQGGPMLDQALAAARAARDPAAIRAADVILGQVLASWAYAPHVGATNSGALVGGDLSLRHDIGIRQVNRTRFEQRWEVPIAPGDRGQISGSYLAMDAALAGWSLRRLASDRIPAPPTVGDNDRSSLVGAIAFSDPSRLSDESMHAIAAAIAEGTRATSAAHGEPRALAELAGRASMSPWRQAVLPWMAVAEPDRIPALFSMTALARIGGLATDVLDAWGTSAVPVGCLCLQALPAFVPELIVGRPVGGIVGAYSADLTFRVAELLTQLKLPASLAPAVMAYALRDFLDGVRPAHPADTEAFGRQAGLLTRVALEDYIGAMAAVGPLRPVSPP